jgi:hypothetical protein
MLVAARTLALAAVDLFENPAQGEATKQAFPTLLAHLGAHIPTDAKPALDYSVH